MKRVLIVCTTDSMFTNFLIPHIKDLVTKGFKVECACSRTGSFIDELRDTTGVVVHEVGFERSPYSPKNIIALKKLNNVVKEKGFDTVFCHEPVGGAMGRVVGHLNHCKVIYMAHGFHFFRGAPRASLIYYLVEKLLAHWTDVLVTINQEDYEASLRFSSKSKVKIPGIGIDIKKFEFSPNSVYIREQFNLNSEDVVCLSVGELIPRKNHEVVIRAIAKLDNDHIHYFIAGDGELKGYLSDLINELNVSNQIHLLGYRKDINKLCNAADVFIMPSLQEGLSVALMEAMATGKVIVASKIRGNVDLIDENKGGILVSPKNVDEYVLALKNIINNKSKWKEYSKYNMDKVKQFSIDSVKTYMDEIYKLV